jgi:hypothetical protein
VRFSWRYARLGSIGLAAVVGVSFYLVPDARAGGDFGPAQRPLRGPLAATVGALPDTAALTTPQLASGRLVDPSGKSVAGATVVLTVEPSNEALAAMKLGQMLPERLISRTTTSSTGAWALRAPATVDLTGSVATAGDVNFMVLALGSDWSGTSFFSAHASKPSRPASKTAGRAVRPGLAAPALAGGDVLSLTPSHSTGLALHVSPDGVTTSALAAKLLPDLPVPNCGTYYDHDYGTTPVVVGQSFSDAKDVTADFKYGEGQSSSLGVGVSVSGKKGTFKASGTVSESTDDSDDFKAAKGAQNRSYVTQFDWRRYRHVCTSGGRVRTISVTARAGHWYGGATHRKTSTIRAGYCVIQEAGSAFRLKKTRASRLTTAVSMSAEIGINLSAQTGYSSDAELVYRMHAKGHPVCGEHGHPADGAGRVQVHSSVHR